MKIYLWKQGNALKETKGRYNGVIKSREGVRCPKGVVTVNHLEANAEFARSMT